VGVKQYFAQVEQTALPLSPATQLAAFWGGFGDRGQPFGHMSLFVVDEASGDVPKTVPDASVSRYAFSTI
jgi:hypothetical protein